MTRKRRSVGGLLGGVGHPAAPFPVASNGKGRPLVGPWERQIPLFDPGPLRPGGTKEAERIARIAMGLGPRARTVFVYVEACGALGATVAEICAGCRLAHQQASPRVHDLAADGLIVDSGKRRTTTTGARAVVYVVRGTKLRRST